MLAEIDVEFPPVVVDLDLGTAEVGASHTSPATILPELPRHVTTQYELHLAPLRVDQDTAPYSFELIIKM